MPLPSLDPGAGHLTAFITTEEALFPRTHIRSPRTPVNSVVSIQCLRRTHSLPCGQQVMPGGDYLLGFLPRSCADRDNASRKSLSKAISGHAWFRASGVSNSDLLQVRRKVCFQRYTFETHVLDSMFPHKRRSLCVGRTWSFFLKSKLMCAHILEDLKNVDENPPQFFIFADERESLRCVAHVAQYFPTMGAIVLTDKSVITVQTAVASTFGTKNIGFEKERTDEKETFTRPHEESTLEPGRARWHNAAPGRYSEPLGLTP